MGRKCIRSGKENLYVHIGLWSVKTFLQQKVSQPIKANWHFITWLQCSFPWIAWHGTSCVSYIILTANTFITWQLWDRPFEVDRNRRCEKPNCFNKIAVNLLNSDKTSLFLKCFGLNIRRIGHTLNDFLSIDNSFSYLFNTSHKFT